MPDWPLRNSAREPPRSAHGWDGDISEIRIGSLPLARSQILPEAINALTRKRPEVRVSVVDGPYGDLLHGLRHGRLDLIIGALRDPVPVNNVVQETLFEDALAVAARAGHPLAGSDRVTIPDLASYPWVVPEPGIPTREHFDALFGSAGIGAPAPQVGIELPDPGARPAAG